MPSLSVHDNPVTDDLSRRRFGAAAGLSLAAWFGAACSTASQNTDDGASSETRTVDTPMGPVEVPVDPQRVVSLDAYVGLQALDELGAPVIATGTLGGGLRTLVSAASQELPSIGVTALGDMQLEAIAAAAPDLIVGRQPIGEEYYAELSGIAPTVLIPFTYWRDQYIDVADSVGLTARASQNFTGLDERIAALRSDLEQAWPNGLRLSVVRVSDTSGDVRSYNTLTASATFLYADILSGAGIVPSANFLPGADPSKVNTAVSAENLPFIDGDVIIYYVGAGGQADAGVAVEQALTSSPLWSRLSAVQANRAFKVDSAPWFDGYNLSGANAVIDDLRRILL
ncbi:ABC transporter substrate-binding protein [Rhodococcus fascians]|uniref:ABC transporter substrate-binding protein n=1 Tax=Rhodococcus sp. NKCM2511 TaxID=2766011 RepID=UPI001910C69E|nr:ABC transporter substrate-binding protein [Rhodococcus sp. NKCM2511]MBY4274422.1 ABC transporter substrate-binding protein [Rhodococcus fascians]MBY4432439.1 ABC transporter substrate-binding protein [Rhodococcus fascians]GHP18465.1 iron ABC transporter permease [Rhodococcus sp. NKCM2511]